MTERASLCEAEAICSNAPRIAGNGAADAIQSPEHSLAEPDTLEIGRRGRAAVKPLVFALLALWGLTAAQNPAIAQPWEAGWSWDR